MKTLAAVLCFILLTTAADAAALSHEALASYITGRVTLTLAGGTEGALQYCEGDGCAVVVQ